MRTNRFDPKYISRLAKKFLSGTATEEERQLLHDWYDSINNSDTEIVVTEDGKTKDQFGREAFLELQERIDAEKNKHNKQNRSYKLPAWAIAAAMILIMVGAGVYYTSSPLTSKKTATVQVQTRAKEIAAPTDSKPVLTLADGSKILLSNVNTGYVATQGNAKVEKAADGRLSYHASEHPDEVVYNTLTVPKGSNTTSLMLSDGTIVWLNVASAITFPTFFKGSERKVIIKGEVYFEVAKDITKPFIIEKENSDVRIQVLGTHFNVNAYDDEQEIKVALLEGAVKVSKQSTKQFAIIKPGQQASITNTIKVAEVNTEDAVAWKNGFFKFNKADIQTIMRQAARWYDVDIQYVDKVSADKFSGVLSRNVNLTQFLKILEYSEVKTKVEDKTIVVGP